MKRGTVYEHNDFLELLGNTISAIVSSPMYQNYLKEKRNGDLKRDEVIIRRLALAEQRRLRKLKWKRNYDERNADRLRVQKRESYRRWYEENKHRKYWRNG